MVKVLRVIREAIIMKPFIFHQGDIFGIQVTDVDESKLERITPELDNQFVVHHGEAMGHYHVFDNTGDVVLFLVKDETTDVQKVMIARVAKPTPIRHITRNTDVVGFDDRHNDIILPPGDYKLKTQVMYTNEGIRALTD